MAATKAFPHLSAVDLRDDRADLSNTVLQTKLFINNKVRTRGTAGGATA
jgi:hypothetical protein